MSIIKMDVVLTASGEQASGKSFLLRKVWAAALNQPNITVIEDHLEGHEIHVVGEWDMDLEGGDK